VTVIRFDGDERIQMVLRITVDKEEIDVDENSSLLDAIMKTGIQLTSPCGGKGKCGKCLIRIFSEEGLKDPTSREKELLDHDDVAQGYRLACQTFPRDGMVIDIPEESRELTAELLLKHAKTKRIEERALTRQIIEITDRKTVEELKDHLEKIMADYSHDEILKEGKLVNLLGQNKIVAWLDSDRLAALTPEDETRIGVALDIGSTTMVAYVFDIEKQEIVAVESLTNPQRKFGEDIMSRIDISMRDRKNYEMLRDTLRKGIGRLLQSAVEKIGLSPENIIRLSIVGNTAMHHFFLGLDVTKLGKVPFSPETKDAIEIKGSNLEMPEINNCTVSAPPLVAGFVGADLVAVLLATELADSENPTAAIDIGTNAEIALAGNGRLMSCSAAAGPAFEGGNISHGMRAAEGAICSVWFENGKLEYEIIGEGQPIGLCGSGLIDFVAEGLRQGIIDSSGGFVQDCCGDRLVGRHGKARYVIFSNGKKEISVTQGDVRQLQLAKAAIHSGLEILMERLGIEKLDRLLLAGAFGTNMSARNGRLIGMLPEMPLNNIVPVGNAAGTGAIQLLTDKKARKRVLETVGKTEYVELSEERDFQKRFISALDFPHSDLSKYPEPHRMIRKRVERRL